MAWADKVAIQETINRYSDAANRADWDALESCYAPGSVWEVTEPNSLRFEEPERIREGVVNLIGRVETFLQVVHNTVVTLHDDGTASVALDAAGDRPDTRDFRRRVLGNLL